MKDDSENPDRVKAVQERRRSNAAGIHQDKREKRQRTRSDKIRKEIEEQE